MQIDAIYENGIIKPRIPLKLKKTRVEVKVIIPNNVIVEENQLETGNLREQISSMLGKYSKARSARTPAEDKAVWHEHLAGKYSK